jgi:HSP20 family protein
MTLYAYPFPHRMARRWMATAETAQTDRYLAVNIQDENEAYVLTALVPGLKAEDVNVQVLEDVVSIEGKYPEDENEYLVKELSSGSFRRELRLPVALESNKVEATIVDGVLTVRLPKAESARPKTIKVAVK